MRNMTLMNSESCCGVSEIDWLQTHKDPKKAMIDLCNQMVEQYYDYESYSYKSKGGDLQIPGLITLTAVVKYTGKDKKTKAKGYGKEFASFIVKNRLGELVAGPVAPNRLNHPTHQVRIWVWKPNVGALRKWYKENRDESDY